jgi:hypothetical protein
LITKPRSLLWGSSPFFFIPPSPACQGHGSQEPEQETEKQANADSLDKPTNDEAGNNGDNK